MAAQTQTNSRPKLLVLAIIVLICIVPLVLNYDFNLPQFIVTQNQNPLNNDSMLMPTANSILQSSILQLNTLLEDLYPKSIFDNCAINDFMDIMRIKWENNTYCEWDFEPNECQAIHKMNYTEYINVLQLLEIHNITMSFWGDSVTRRIGKTLDLFLNQKGDVHKKWHDKTYKMAFPYTVYRQKITPHWHTEWTPMFDNVTTLLNNTKYLNKYYLVGKEETQHHIVILGVGIWELYPQYGRGSRDETYPVVPGIIENFMKWLYDNYYDQNSELLTDVHKRMHIIIRTQPGLAIARGRYGYTQEDLQNLTNWWNLNLVKSAKKYGIPIFDAYQWSSYQPGYHINLEQETHSEEMYDQIDHLNCPFCVNGSSSEWGKYYRHQCVECEDFNCVHMRSNGRMIMLQQIINAVNILAHKEIF